MNDELVEKFINQILYRRKCFLNKNYNPKNLIVQHLPVKERVNKMEINCMRNGYIVDVLTSVDIQEIVEIGGRVGQIYEEVIYRENFKVPPCKKVYS